MFDGEIASVTSLVGRFPVFDYVNISGVCYLRFKKDIVFADSSNGPVYIIPTDDNKIKFVITTTTSDNLISHIQSAIATMTEKDSTELLMPTFRITHNSHLQG